MSLDRKKLTAIGHADHVVCNPVSLEKVDAVLDLLELGPGARVLDAGCGKAEILMRLLEKRGVSAVGVDANARFLDEARRRAATRVPAEALELVEGDVCAYLRERNSQSPSHPGSTSLRESGSMPASLPGSTSPRQPGSTSPLQPESASALESGSSSPRQPEARTRVAFDAAICTGSTHAFGGYRQTLRALRDAVRPGGMLLVGEGYWKKDPHLDYLAAIGASRAEFTDHAGNVARGVEEGLVPLYSAVSSDDEWDRYEGLYLRAVERYVAAHPEDPDTPPMRDHIRRWRDAYLRWGRDTLGFGLYLFRKD